MTSRFSRFAVGPGVGVVDDGVLHWSATLVALVTLNVFIAPAVAELEFMPEFVPAEALPGAEALAFAPLFPAVAPVPAAAVVPAAFVFVPAPPAVEAALDDPPSCPVSWTSLPTNVRTASRFPVILYVLPDRSVSV